MFHLNQIGTHLHKNVVKILLSDQVLNGRNMMEKYDTKCKYTEQKIYKSNIIILNLKVLANKNVSSKRTL